MAVKINNGSGASTSTATARTAVAPKPATKVTDTTTTAQRTVATRPQGKSPELTDTFGCITPPLPNVPGVVNNPNNNSDLYLNEDPDDFYFDLVFQKQTYLEKLRAKFEGKMMILSWPKPYELQSVIGYDGDVTDEANDLTNDKVYWVRMMINGFWKQVVDTKVFRAYAALNGYDIGKLSVTDEESLTDIEKYRLLYGEKGLINLLVEAGGITVLADDGLASPIWNDFPHIVEADRLDFCEYKKYLDHYNNGGAPFEIEILKPYEPAGSTAYYLPSRIVALSEQVRLQQEFESLRIIVKDRWRQLASSVEEKAKITESLRTDYSKYINILCSDDNEVLNIFVSTRGQWRLFKKSKDGSSITTIASSDNLFGLLRDFNTTDYLKNMFPYKFSPEALRRTLETIQTNPKIAKQIFANPEEELEDFDIQDIADMAKLDIDEWLDYGLEIAGSALDDVLDNGSADRVPLETKNAAKAAQNNRTMPDNPSRGITDTRPREGNRYQFPKLTNGELSIETIILTKTIKNMVRQRIQDRVDDINLITRGKQADSMVVELRDDLNACRNFLDGVDEQIERAEDIENFRNINDALTALQEDLDDMTNNDIEFCNAVFSDMLTIAISHMELLYESIQEFRRRVNEYQDDNGSKYYVSYPPGVATILNRYIPEKVIFESFT
jgi:hypothetical protein